jgi:hypothetical protein
LLREVILEEALKSRGILHHRGSSRSFWKMSHEF